MGVLAVAVVLSTAPLQAVDFTVDSELDLADNAPGDGLCGAGSFLFCTLRAAVQETNALPGADTITLPAGRFVLTREGAGEEWAATGDLDVRDDLSIVGQGAALTIVDAAGLDRVLHVPSGFDPLEVKIENLSLTGGVAADPTPSAPADVAGGGILVQGPRTLRVYHTRIVDNLATVGGGIALLATDLTIISDSELVGNRVLPSALWAAQGGGLYSSASSDCRITVVDSTIADNDLDGLAVQQTAPLSTDGLFVYNSTISGNRGRGVKAVGTNAVLGHATLYGNAFFGLAFAGSLTNAVVAAKNTIVAHNGLQDCDLSGGTRFLEGSANLSTDNTCDFSIAAGDKIEDPQLYPLGYYSPPPDRIARAHHPRWLSPVVDAGLAFPALTTDQEGYGRQIDGELPSANNYDIGSIEVLPCVSAVDIVFANETIPVGSHGACRKLIADYDVLVNGQVILAARDSVILGDGFWVLPGSELRIEISREAGAPAP